MKKSMKRVLAAVFSLMMLFSIVGCAGNEAPATPATPDVPAAEAPAEETPAVTPTGGVLNVAIWDDNQRPGIQLIVDEFTAATGIQAEIQVIPWGEYWTLLEASAGGGDLPDVFWMHGNEVQRYMEHGFLMDLTGTDLTGFPQDLIDLYTYDGRIYAVPKDIDTVAIWYNATMFEEAGVETPNDSWTWEDFYNAAVALTTDDQYGIAWGPGTNQEGFWNVIYSMGGYVVNEDKTASGFDNPNTIAAMEFTYRLIRNAGPSMSVLAESDQRMLFEAGQLAMLTAGSWMVPAFRVSDFFIEHARVAVLPMSDAGNRVSIYNGLGWVASANTSMPEEARALVEWFGTRDMQLMQAELGVTMSALDGTSDAWAGNTDAFDITPYFVMLEGSVMYPYTRATARWLFPQIDVLTEVWAGNLSLEEGLQQITDLMNEAIAQE